MHMKKMKRFCSAFLAIVMLLGCLPVSSLPLTTAYATENTSEESDTGTDVSTQSEEEITYTQDANAPTFTWYGELPEVDFTNVTRVSFRAPTENYDSSTYYYFKTGYEDAEVRVDGVQYWPVIMVSCNNADPNDEHAYFTLVTVNTSAEEYVSAWFNFEKDHIWDYLFANCQNLVYADLSYADLKNRTPEEGYAGYYGQQSTEGMFYGCSELHTIVFGDRAYTENAYQMFSGCTSLENLVDLDKFDLTNNLTFSQMFEYCASLESIELDVKGIYYAPLSDGNDNDFFHMFLGCSSLESVKLVGPKGVHSSYGFMGIFQNCTSLTHVYINDFEMTSTFCLFSAFRGVTSLEVLDLSGCTLNGVQNDHSGFIHTITKDFYPFQYLTNLKKIVLPKSVVDSPLKLPHTMYLSADDTVGVTALTDDCDTESGNTVLAVKETVTYHSNNGKNESLTKTYLWGEEISIAKNQFASTDSYYTTFFCWGDRESGSDTFYLPGDSLTIVEDMDLYAWWSTGKINLTNEWKEAFDGWTDGNGGYTHKALTEVYFLSGKTDIESDPDWCGQWLAFGGYVDSNTDGVLWMTRCGTRLYIEHRTSSGSPSDYAIYLRSGLVSGCTSVQKVEFGQDWRYMELDCESMFEGCTALTSAVLPPSNAATGYMSIEKMFYGCSSLESADLTGFDGGGHIYYAADLFNGCSALTGVTVTGSSLAHCDYFDRMFANCTSLTSIDLSDWDTSSANSMAGLFSGCTELTSVTFPTAMAVSGCSDFSDMFSGCTALTSLDMSGVAFRGSNMSGMFENCTSLKTLDISNFTGGSVTDFSSVFANCSALTDIAWGRFALGSSCSDMSDAFSGCVGITSLDLSGWDLSGVKNISGAFKGMTGLSELKFNPNVTAASITTMSEFLYNNTGLVELDLSSFDFSKATDSVDLTSLTGLKVIHLPQGVKAETCPIETKKFYSSAAVGSGWSNYLFAATATITSLRVRYAVTYNANGGTYDGNIYLITALHGVPFTIRSSGYTSETGALASWNTSANGGGSTYELGAQILVTAPLTLYAIYGTWEAYLDPSWQTTFNNSSLGITTSQITAVYMNGTTPSSYSSKIDVSVSDGSDTVYLYLSGTEVYIVAEKSSKIYTTTCGSLFANLTAAETIDISNLDTSKSTHFDNMFAYDAELVNLTLPDIMSTDSCEDSDGDSADTIDIKIQYMFVGCSALTKIDLSCMKIVDNPGTIFFIGVFVNCSSLKHVVFPSGCYRLMLQNAFAVNDNENDKIPVLDVFDLSHNTGAGTYSLYVMESKGYTGSKYIFFSDVKLVKTGKLGLSVYGDIPISVPLCTGLDTIDAPVDDWTQSTSSKVVVTFDAEVLYRRYTVTYDDGSGNTADPVYYLYEHTIPAVADNSFTKTGYVFAGWNTKADGSGTSYQPGDALPEYEDITLYAQWKPGKAYLNPEWRNVFDDASNISISFKELTEIHITSSLPSGYESMTALDVTDKNNATAPVTLYLNETVAYIVNQYHPTEDIYVTTCQSLFANTGTNTDIVTKTISVENLNTSEATSMEDMFKYQFALTSLDLSTLDFSNVTSTKYMFHDNYKLSGIVFPSNLNTEKLTTMYGMFTSNRALRSVDLSGFDTGSVTSLYNLFWHAYGLYNVNVSGWDTSKVTAVDGAFGQCYALQELDLSTWDLSSVTSATSMFEMTPGVCQDTTNYSNQTALKLIKQPLNVTVSVSLPVTMYETANGTGQTTLTQNLTASTTIRTRYTVTYDPNYNGEATQSYHFLYGDSHTISSSGVTRQYYTVRQLSTNADGTGTVYPSGTVYSDYADLKLYYVWSQNTGEAYFGSDWKTKFDAWSGNGGYTYATVTGIHVGVVPESGLDGLSYLDISLEDNEVPAYLYLIDGQVYIVDGFTPTSDVYIKNGADLFLGCKAATVIEISKLNSSTLVSDSFDEMFSECESVTALDVSGLNTGVIKNFYRAFNGCKALTSIDLSAWSGKSCTNLSSIFQNCTKLESVTFGGFAPVWRLTGMQDMFVGCTSLKSVDISGWDMSGVTRMDGTFQSTSSLESITFPEDKSVTKITQIEDCFNGASKLVELDLSGFDLSGITTAAYYANVLTGCTSLKLIYLPTALAGGDIAIPVTLWGDNESMTEYSSGSAMPAADEDAGLSSIRFQYSITYHSNYPEGTAETETGYYLYNLYPVFPDDVFTYKGHGLSKWNTAANGTGTEYAIGTATVLPNQNLTLYAQWSLLYAYLTGNYNLSDPDTETNKYSAWGEIYKKKTGKDYSHIENIYINGKRPDNWESLTPIEVGDMDIGTAQVYLYVSGNDAYIVSAADYEAPVYITSCLFLFRSSGAKEIDISNLNTSKSEAFGAMFDACYSLSEIVFPEDGMDVSGAKTNLTWSPFKWCFSVCSKLTELDLSTAITGADKLGEIGIEGMFNGCGSLNKLTMMECTVSSTTDTFNSCTSLEVLDLSEADFSSTNISTSTLSGLSALKKVVLPTATRTGINLPQNMYFASSVTTPYTTLQKADTANSKTELLVRYSISYNGNGGTGSGISTVYYLWGSYDKSVHTAAANTFVYKDYKFANWNTASDGKGVSYLEAAAIAENTTVVLYAQWTGVKAYIDPSVYNAYNSSTRAWQDAVTVGFGIPDGWELKANYQGSSQTYDFVLYRERGAVKYTWSGTNMTLEGSAGRVYGFECDNNTYYLINVDSPTSDIYVTDANYMFYNCNRFTGFDFTKAKLNTSECRTMGCMFQYCTFKTFAWPEEFNTANVEAMYSIFNNCQNLETLDLTHFNSASVTDMNYMVYCAEKLESITFPSGFVHSGVKHVQGMFHGDTSNKVGAPKLTVLDMSTWDLSGIESPNNMLTSMTSLRVLYLPKAVSSNSSYVPSLAGLNLYSDVDTPVTALKGYTTAGDSIRYRYTVTFHSNDGTDGKTETHYLHTADGSVTSVTMLGSSDVSRRYYTLNSWNTDKAAAASGTSYTVGTAYDLVNTDLAVYAIWQKNTGNAYLGGNNIWSSEDSWRRQWLLKYGGKTSDDIDDAAVGTSDTTATNAEGVAYNNGWFDSIKAVYVGKKPSENFYIDEDNGFVLTDGTTTYQPLDVSTSDSPVPVYCYYDAAKGTVWLLNGFDAGVKGSISGADVYLHKDQSQWQFRGLREAAVIDVAKLNGSEVTQYGAMFYGCHAVEELDLSGLRKATGITNMWEMFGQTRSLTTLDLSGFDLSKVTGTGGERNPFSNSGVKVIILPDKVPTADGVTITISGITAQPLYGDDKDMTEYSYIPAKETGLTSIRVKYTVTYHEGTAETEVPYLHGLSTTTKELTDEKYYTAGWTTKSTGTEIEYAAGVSVTFSNKDMDLYAVSTLNTAGSSGLSVGAGYREGDGSANVICLDLSWGAMTFTYHPEAYQEWNAEKLYYETAPAGWSYEAGSNVITVTNHSNAELTVGFGYAAANDSKTAGVFSQDGSTVSSVDLPSAVGKSTDAAELTKTVEFKITEGVMTEQSDSVLGHITVTVAVKKPEEET